VSYLCYSLTIELTSYNLKGTSPEKLLGMYWRLSRGDGVDQGS
jgi:hypothetical protein